MFLLWMAVFVVFSGLGGIAQRRLAADRRALRHRRRRGLHGPGRPLDHHDELRRGPRAQPGAADLRGRRRGRLQPRDGRRRPADRDRLALGVLRAGADGAGAARRRLPRRARATRPRAQGSFDLAGALAITAAMVVLVFTVVRAPDVDLAPTLLGAVGEPRAARGVRARSSAAPPQPLVRLGILRNASLLRANAGHDAVHRRLRRLPVRRRALPAGAARLVAGGDRPRARRPRASTRSSRRRSPRGSSSASASCP